MDQFHICCLNTDGKYTYPTSQTIGSREAVDVAVVGGATEYADGASAATPTGTQVNWNEAGTQRATSLVKPIPIQPGTGVTFTLAALPTGTNTIGAVKDGGPNQTISQGVSGAAFTSADASGADAAVTDAPTSGQKLVLTDVWISSDTAMRIDIKCETSGVILYRGYVSANCGFQQLTPRGKIKLATADKKAMVRTSAAGNIAVMATYYSEA